MPKRVFKHVVHKCSLRSAASTPRALAKSLSDFGHPLMSAAQGAEMLAVLQNASKEDYRFYHVVGGRGVDKWNLTDAQHSIGDCYYRYHESHSLEKLVHPSDQKT